ncbi:hypothetical protein HKX48_001082 [Thoreauomyces humboldtii]|nr:hypothetical protein HKX48_001082 [Thoreauomyces humboldtii]
MHADGPSPSKRVSSPKPADKSLPPRTAPGVLEPPPHTPPPLPPLYHPVTLLRLIRRIFVLSTLFAPLLLTFPIWWFFNKGRKPHQLKTWWIRYLAWTLEQSGGLFVKLGQWLSSRGDVVPNEVCTVLARLQSDVRPHSARDSRKAIERMYGVEALEEVFEEFDVVPVGVGAVAQVHRAVLKPHFPDLRGEEVAIKVLHPGIRHRVKTDLVLVELFARFVSLLPGTSHLAIRDEVATFARMMRDQLDLRVEAWNLQVFRKNFLGVEDVAFPKPISCGRDVLVETFHRGLLLRDVLDNGPTGFDGAIADAGIKAFMKMILRDNFFHSDLHPGNILLTFTYTPESATLAQQAGAWVSTQIDPTPSTRQATQAPFRPKVVDDATLDNLKRAPKDAWGPILERLRNEGFRPRLIVLDAGLVGSLKKENLENTKAGESCAALL